MDAHVALTEWVMVGVAPGSADHRLEGLDEKLLPCRVPGTAAAALAAAGQWQARSGRDLDAEDWWFRCRFDSPWQDDEGETVLRLDGLATVAEVWLNGEQILTSSNAHAAHVVPVGLRSEANELVIGIRALAPLLAERRPRPRWRTRLVPTQNLRWYRTPLIGRLPAFAPEPAPVGPWRPVTLERRRIVSADGVRVRAGLDGDNGVVRIRAVLKPLGNARPSVVTARLDGPSGLHETTLELADVGGALIAGGELTVPGVARWSPHTHGEPVLHDLELQLRAGERELTLDRRRIGFRTLEAATEPGLALKVNGIPVFCRGGSWLPNAMALDSSRPALRALLDQARDAGLNMVRLSGVGTYASNDFLELCDELGLLVWQDFPFANLDYPADDELFRAGVEQESQQFLSRAGSHPSLVVLCGNSEIEQQVGMLGLDPELGRGALFGDLLPGLVTAEAVDAHFVPSTPTGGVRPFCVDTGVAHYFGIGAYRRPLEDARRAEVRFATECLAFANVPNDAAVDRLAPGGAARLVHHPAWKSGVPRDVGAGWDFDDVRDHYLRELFGLDPVELRWADPERYLRMSRVVPGEVMAAAFGEWRRARSSCAGALVWTLNDPVPGAGWGVFDSDGVAKSPYWYLKRALAPVAVWMTDEGSNGVAVHVANDTPEAREAQLDVTLHRRDGTAVEHGSLDLVLAAHGTVEFDAEAVLGHFADVGYTFRFGPPPHDVVVATLRNGDALLSQAFHYPLGRPAELLTQDDLGLDGVLTAGNGDGYTLELVTRRLAQAVALDIPGFRPDDDFVTVAPGGRRSIRVRPETRTSGQQDQPRDTLPGGFLHPLNGYNPVRIRLPGEGRT